MRCLGSRPGKRVFRAFSFDNLSTAVQPPLPSMLPFHWKPGCTPANGERVGACRAERGFRIGDQPRRQAGDGTRRERARRLAALLSRKPPRQAAPPQEGDKGHVAASRDLAGPGRRATGAGSSRGAVEGPHIQFRQSDPSTARLPVCLSSRQFPLRGNASAWAAKSGRRPVGLAGCRPGSLKWRR